MSKKKSAAPKVTLPDPNEPPAGLVNAFRMLEPDAAPDAAYETYQYARRIVASLDKQEVGVVERELLAATRQVFGCEDAYNPEFRAETGMKVGYAVCWILMASVTGKDGAL